MSDVNVVDDTRTTLAVRFRGRPLHLNIPADAPTLLEFLRRYFEPYFAVEPAAKEDTPFATVTVMRDDPGRTATDFVDATPVDVDRSKGFLACRGLFKDHGARRDVWLEPFKVLVEIDRPTRNVVLCGASEERLLIPTLRLIEDLTVFELERRGCVFLHASAVVADGGAVIAAGNKKAGKTTTLCRALHGFDVRKLANDNVVAWVESGAVIVRGWPGFFKVDIATVAANEELSPFYPASRRELLDSSDALWATYEKVAFYPGQGAELFGTTIEPEAPLRAIILPAFSKDLAPSVTPCDPADLDVDMRPFLQGSQHPNHPDWMGLGTAGGAKLAESLGNILNQASKDVAAYRISWAPSLDDMLADVPALRTCRKSLRRIDAGDKLPWTWPPLPPIFES